MGSCHHYITLQQGHSILLTHTLTLLTATVNRPITTLPTAKV